jgi:hypothetical protein
MQGGGNAVYFGPYMSAPVSICAENNTNTLYTFGVRTQDIYNSSSIFISNDVLTGRFNACLPTPDDPDEGKIQAISLESDFDNSLKIHPNPFNSLAVVSYSIKEDSDVSIDLYNISGQVVRSLFSGHNIPGFYFVEWDGRNNEGASLPSGLYFRRLRIGAQVLSSKMVLVK